MGRTRIGTKTALLALSATLLTMALALLAAPARAATDGWFPQAVPPAAGGLEAVDFVDELHGWAVGSSGTILATDDGGSSWDIQSSSTTVPLLDVAFVSASHGWAVGGEDIWTDGVVVATGDGGSTWSPQALPAGVRFVCSVDFVDALHGWAIAATYDGTRQDVVLATDDGGASWTMQTLPAGGPYWLSDVDFIDATHGWIVGDGVIMATTNGGVTWTPQTSGEDYQPFFAVDFADASHGWAVGQVGLFASTHDGGATWQSRFLAEADFTLVDVEFVDVSRGWISGSYGTILVTVDGGDTWDPQASGTDSAVVDVEFVDALHGWAVAGGSILATTTGGFSPATDATPPATTASGADALWHNAPVTVTFSAVDEPGGSGMSGGAAKTEYQLDAGAWTTGTSVTVAAPAGHANDGAHTISYRSTDAAGNLETAKQVTVRIDTTAPAGGFTLAAGAATTTTTSVSGDSSVADAHGPLEMRFSVDGKASWGAWQAYAASAALSLPAGAGEKTVHAQYRDAAGNLLELADAITYAPPSGDVTAPTVTAAGATGGAWYRSARLVTLTAADEPGGSGVASITYTLDGVETTVPAASALVDVAALPNAAHLLSFHAADGAGNAGGDQTLSFTIDTTGPVTAAKVTSGRRGRAIALRYKVADNLSPKATAIRIVVKNSRNITVATIRPAARNTATWYAAKWTPKARGTYRYHVYAKDLAGNAQSKIGSARVVVR